jgi:hypothetical protein
MNTKAVLHEHLSQLDQSDSAVRKSMGWLSLFLLLTAGGFFVSRHLSMTLVLVLLVMVLTILAMIRPLMLSGLHKAVSSFVCIASFWLRAAGRWLAQHTVLPIWRKLSSRISRRSSPPDASV